MRVDLWEATDQKYVDLLTIQQQQALREQDSIPACFSLASILTKQDVHLEAAQISHVVWGMHRGVATLKQ